MDKSLEDFLNITKLSETEYLVEHCATFNNGEPITVKLLVRGDRFEFSDEGCVFQYLDKEYNLEAEDVKMCIAHALKMYGVMRKGHETDIEMFIVVRNINLLGKAFMSFINCIYQICNMDIFFDSPIDDIISIHRRAADGEASSQCELGWRYRDGEGVKKDLEKSYYWYKKSAEQGYASAQNGLGWCYNMGDGVAKDLKEAVYWFMQGAAQGNASAQNNLAWCYENGEGVMQDYVKAVEWYLKSAKNGSVPAKNHLGDCYYFGHGVDENKETALQYYQEAARLGSEKAEKSILEKFAKE